ncbi:hypothetical protein F5Y16DRAFT_250095 [Xylariaceae sp. FL0255]|nr:hypothetical protein F5Y16DRAFT_250095 [Xylariaceae sp. FL0255]
MSASATFPISTPSPPGTVRTPNTPKHGYCDNWEPYSPRKSARISERQRSSNRTPSPRSSAHQSASSSSSSSRASRKAPSTTTTTFSTPMNSPQKKRMPAMDSVRRASAAIPAEGSAYAADAPALNRQSQDKHHATSATVPRNQISMLPTPDKTPRKPPSAATEAASRSIARSLFVSDNDVTLSTKKKSKKYSGIGLDSFSAEDVEEDIEIFTDSRDQVPEIDKSVDNPFYGDSAFNSTAAAAPPKRRGRSKKVTIPGEGRQTIEDAVGRDDGCVVVFRGKTMFRPFEDANGPSTSGSDEDKGRRVTRSSIKPRLLFPPNSGKGKQDATSSSNATPNLEDEEAPTEIEDNDEAGDMEGVVQSEMPHTPAHDVDGDKKLDVPGAPRFAPASPPSVRATRSSSKPQPKIPSPFDNWRRSKSRSESNNNAESKSPAHGQKRDGQHLAQSTSGTKRQRA